MPYMLQNNAGDYYITEHATISGHAYLSPHPNISLNTQKLKHFPISYITGKKKTNTQISAWREGNGQQRVRVTIFATGMNAPCPVRATPSKPSRWLRWLVHSRTSPAMGASKHHKSMDLLPPSKQTIRLCSRSKPLGYTLYSWPHIIWLIIKSAINFHYHLIVTHFV